MSIITNGETFWGNNYEPDAVQLYNALPVAGAKHNRYCAPAALAAVAGCNTGEAAAFIRQVTGKPHVMRVEFPDLIEAALLAGLELRHHETPPRKITYRDYIADRYNGELAIVYVTGHFVAIGGVQYVDTFARIPSPVNDYPKPRQTVKSCAYLRRA